MNISNDSNFSTPKDELTQSCRSFEHGTDCQEPKPKAQGEIQTKDCRPPPSSRVDGSKPTVPSSTQGDNQTCDLPGCERIAEDRQMSQGGRIDRVCAEYKKKSVMIATAVTRAAHCEFTGCDRNPRYGTQEGILSFCQAHKRAGQYTVRDGQLFVATRDGNAFRDNPGTTAVAAAASTGVATTASAAATVLPQDTNALSPTPADRRVPHALPYPSGPVAPTHEKDKTHKKQMNRPCLFPGCTTRPHYGLPDGRTMFCVTHKKDGMVHLLKESKSKAGVESKAHKEKKAPVAEKNIKRQKARGCASSAGNMGGPNGKGKGPAESKSSAKKVLVPEKATQAEERKTNIVSSLASAREKESQLLTRRAEAPGLPPSGLAPSDEMRLFQEARESARAAAEASGSGRRPRPPSRKLLEASGKLMCDSIQWMTKEKKEEEARFKREMKEQRKAAAAAGLKFGHRIEALALSTPVGAEAEGGGAGTRGGETASAGAWTGINAAVSSAFWRKLTPAETLLAAGKQPSVDGAQLDLPDSTMGTGKKGKRASAALAAPAQADVSKKKRKAVASAGESIVQVKGARTSKHSRQARRRMEGGDSKKSTD